VIQPNTYLTSNLAELTLSTPGFDDLQLLGTTVDDGGNKFSIRALDAEATFDNPVPIDVSVQRWLTDGAVASTQGHDNRTPYFKVVVSAATSAELAAGEQALAQRAERIQRGEQIALLTWVSNEGRSVAPAAVFEVWTWHLEHIFDGSSEGRLARMYGIRATSKPWVRSEDVTEVDALTTALTPTTVSIDACTSTTGWTTSATTLSTSGGAVKGTTSVSGPTVGAIFLQRSGSVTGLAALPYLMVDWSVTGGSLVGDVDVKIGGVSLVKAAQLGTVSYWTLPAGTTGFTLFKITASIGVPPGVHSVVLSVADISATDTIGGVGSNKQLSRSLETGGSVKTSGSLQLASPDATALGVVLAYTTADDDSGYSPPMRQYRTSGPTVTPDATAVSGNREPLVTAGTPEVLPVTYTVPAARYRESTYAVIGRFFSTSTTTLTATVTAAVAGNTGDSVVGKVVWTAANTWKWGVIGAFTLPPQAVPRQSTVNMVVTVTGAGGGTISIDELYLLDITHGEVSLIDSGTATRLWVDAPDADPTRNRPAVYLGTTDDRTDAVHARYDQVLSLGEHELAPEGATMLTVTDGVGAALASASFYQRWHTQPGA
jgi:hypothetical protein